MSAGGMHLGRVLAVCGLALLTGCATPEFRSDKGEFALRLWPLDARFPNLALASYCGSPCSPSLIRYTVVHLHDGSPSGELEVVTTYLGSRYFDMAPAQAFPPSYSRRPRFRALDSFDYRDQGGRYNQIVAFYHETPSATSHARVVYLHQTDCRDAETRSRAQTDPPRFRLEVAAVVVDEARAFFFLEPPADAPACADLTPGEALGDVKGLPEVMLNRRFVVQVADLDLAKDEFQFSTPSVHSVRVTRERFAFRYSGMECRDSLKYVSAVLPECVRPRAPLTLVADPRPLDDVSSQSVVYDCTSRSSSVDWNVFLGMAAKIKGKESYSQRCRKR